MIMSFHENRYAIIEHLIQPESNGHHDGENVISAVNLAKYDYCTVIFYL